MMLCDSHLNYLEAVLGRENVYSTDEIKKANKSPAIIHYVTGRKPWGAICDSDHQKKYWQYCRLTPFYMQVRRQYWKSVWKNIPQMILKVAVSRKRVYLKLFGVQVLLWRIGQKKT
ncbi:MAG: hypothetical protein ACRC10_09925 [Thermoguttaceae bacterium]